MSSIRHSETDGLSERVNITFEKLLRCLCCYTGTNWEYMLPQVEFAYNASRALGIEHTPFEANLGLSPEEPLDLLLSIRPSIPVSQDAIERLRLLQEMRTVARSVLQLHKDEMQTRTKPSKAPHFVRGDKVPIVTTDLSLRGQSNKKLKDRQLGSLSVEERIGNHIYRLELSATIRVLLCFM
jgi:hypothetical protein